MKLGRKFLKVLLRIVALLAIISFAFYLSSLVGESKVAQDIIARYGFFGIFIISLVSGFNAAVPVPAAAFAPLFFEAGLPFWSAIFFMVLGVTVADIIAYFLGRMGQEVLVHSADGKMFARLREIRSRHPSWPFYILFLFASLVPFPNEILVIPMGFLGYGLFRILPIVFVGNLIFNVLYVSGFSNLFGTF